MIIDISEEIALTRWEYTSGIDDSREVVTEHGQKVLEFIAEHFDVRPLTDEAREAMAGMGENPERLNT